MAASNGHIGVSGLEDGEDKPMLVVKKAADGAGAGITALINRQLQGMLYMHTYS